DRRTPRQTRQERRLRRDLEPLRRRIRDHQVAVLIERDELAVGAHERLLLDAALLPVNLPRPDVDRAQNRLAPLASAREVDRVVDPHRIAMVEAEADVAPQLGRLRLLAAALQLDDLRAGV